MKNIVVIVAGGSGTRFGGPIPKQFVPLKGKPVLMHTLERFAQFFAADSMAIGQIILVLPVAHIPVWKALCAQYDFHIQHDLVEGGETRYHSVKNGLNSIEEMHDGDVVAIHDGVRPLVPIDVIGEAYAMARKTGSAIPVVPMTDSVRAVDDNGKSHALLRSSLRAVQTPQAFDLKSLKQAYELPYQSAFTDDASVYENAGHVVTLINGAVCNIKITGTNDLAIAELLMSHE